MPAGQTLPVSSGTLSPTATGLGPIPKARTIARRSGEVLVHRPIVMIEEIRFHPLNSRRVLEYMEFQTGFKKEDEQREPGEVELTAGKSVRSREIDLVGSFYALGISGITWFTVVNIWDCIGGLEGGWRQMLQIYENVRPELFLSQIDDLRWNADARPLAAAPGSPDLQDLRAEGYRAPLWVYELAQARPGAALDYLAAVRDAKATILAEHNHRLIGLYESMSVDDQIVTIWATDLASQLGALHARDAALGMDDTVPADARLLDWRKRSAEFLVPGSRRETLMVPYPGTRHAPN
jgi:hypothetical protein